MTQGDDQASQAKERTEETRSFLRNEVLLVLQHLLGYPAEYSLHPFPVRELPSLGLVELGDDVGEPVHLGFRCPAGGRWPGPV